MGRLAKPTKIKELGGNPGRRTLNKSEPVPAGGPQRPAGMSATTKAVWDRLVTAMPPGVFTAADSALLYAYCEAVVGHQRATREINKGPKTVTGSTGQVKLSPWLAEQKEAARLIAQLGAKLGLDPVSRQHITTDKDGPDEFGGLIH